MNGDLRDSIETIPAEVAITGLAATRNTAPAARSTASTATIRRDLDKKGFPNVEYKHRPAWEEETYRIFAAFLHHAIDYGHLRPPGGH
jgi:hypothetical protein